MVFCCGMIVAENVGAKTSNRVEWLHFLAGTGSSREFACGVNEAEAGAWPTLFQKALL